MTTETKEIWKPVAGYEGIYDVSNLGRVKTVERTCYLNKSGKLKYHGFLWIPHKY